MRVLWLAMLVGCYNPTPFEPCFTVCQKDDDCQAGFVCGSTMQCANERDECGPPEAGETCFGHGFLNNICFKNVDLPTNDVTVSTKPDFNTDTDLSCTTRTQPAAGAPDVCLVVTRNWTLPAGVVLRVVGSRPFAVLATQNIEIMGELDAHSLLAEAGAGAVAGNAQLCALAQPGTPTSTGGGGGGAGGALATLGGSGGVGSGITMGGNTTPARPVTFVRGGCIGAPGGNFSTSAGGIPGDGGGAIHLIAGAQLLLRSSAVINASGAGGGPAFTRAGGGGGGSGGFIGLDGGTFAIDPNARVFAVGGGGAAGGGMTTPGVAGGIASRDGDPVTTMGMETQAGTGGAASVNGNGAPGGGAVVGSNAAGGGGGGGRGYIGFAGAYMPQSLMVVRPEALMMTQP